MEEISLWCSAWRHGTSCPHFAWHGLGGEEDEGWWMRGPLDPGVGRPWTWEVHARNSRSHQIRLVLALDMGGGDERYSGSLAGGAICGVVVGA